MNSDNINGKEKKGGQGISIPSNIVIHTYNTLVPLILGDTLVSRPTPQKPRAIAGKCFSGRALSLNISQDPRAYAV